jgi:hypothetical protein
MLSATFTGEVQQGRLHIGQPLAAFEGKQVLVTLIVPDIPLGPSRSTTEPVAAPEAEIVEDTGRIRTPPATQTVTAQVIAVGRL